MNWKFSDLWAKWFPVQPRRYPRAACPECGKVLAKTGKGLWAHDCLSAPVVVEEPR